MHATTTAGRAGAPAWLPVVAFAVAVAGCGGGSGGGTGEGDGETAVPAPPPVAVPRAADELAGTVLIEQRRGKVTIEAWFSPLAETGPGDPDAPDWQDGRERCTFVARAAGASADTVVASPLVTLDAGPALTLSSRAGEHARLDAQRLGDTRLYATADRWLVTPLPDDLTLGVPGGSGFTSSGGVPVPFAPAPVVLAPVNGALASATETVLWETSPGSGDRIHLSLSLASLVGDDTRATLDTIDCELDDDGTFTLPGTLAARLPAAHGGIALDIARERTTRHALGASSVSLRSLARP